MSWFQDDGKKPVYKQTRGARQPGSNWLFLLPVMEIAALFSLLKRRR